MLVKELEIRDREEGRNKRKTIGRDVYDGGDERRRKSDGGDERKGERDVGK